LGITSTSPPLPSAKLPEKREGRLLTWAEGAAQFPRASDRSPVSRPHYKRAAPLLRVLAPVLLGAALLAAWQIIVQTALVSTFILPAPAEVARSFWSALSDGSLLHYTRVTMIESLLGCALGALVALPLGYAIAHSRLVASTLQPYLAASQAVPAIAIAPLIGLWLDYGLTPVVALCALIVFFPMVITSVLGLRMLDQDVLDAARVEGAGRWALLWHIEFPLALPSILAGLRTSLTLSITGSVVGEFVVGGNGLGELLLIERSFADTAGVFVTLFMLALLAAVLYGGVRLIERRLLP
jgi:NitT/TauT family transport system permease protein